MVEIGNDLKSLQEEVRGYIEAVYPWPEPVCLVCNEDGKFAGLPLNRALRDDEGRMYDAVAGTFLITGIAGDELCDLPAEYADKFTRMFAEPEDFLILNGKLAAIPHSRKMRKEGTRQ